MTFGLIGYGRFGRLAARYLSRYGKVIVYDPSRAPRTRSGKGTKRQSLDAAASCSVVILAVPISELQRVLHDIRPHVKRGALVVDVCAVKMRPVAWMKRALPRSVQILGSHPLFGPDSASRSVKGKTIVLCPVRLSRATLETTRRALAKAGLHILMMSPAEHDRMMAETILLSQYIGRLVDGAGLKDWGGVSVSYDHLRTVVAVARRDTRQLFLDMWAYNPYAAALHRSLLRSMRTLTKSAGH